MSDPVDRRRFLAQGTAGLASLAAGLGSGCDDRPEGGEGRKLPDPPPADPLPNRPAYRGPNVILCRFGGGVRRQETVHDPQNTYCPFVYHELAGKHGVLFSNVLID